MSLGPGSVYFEMYTSTCVHGYSVWIGTSRTCTHVYIVCSVTADTRCGQWDCVAV